MRYDITNIPIAEVFEEMDGCPICRLRNTLEKRAVEYITGAAMMEPDIRIETNKKGFCYTHYQQILGQRNRLSVALMMVCVNSRSIIVANVRIGFIGVILLVCSVELPPPF